MTWGFKNRQRVQYIGVTGRATGPTGRVIREFKSGVRVRWDDSGVHETVHPDSLRVIP